MARLCPEIVQYISYVSVSKELDEILDNACVGFVFKVQPRYVAEQLPKERIGPRYFGRGTKSLEGPRLWVPHACSEEPVSDRLAEHIGERLVREVRDEHLLERLLEGTRLCRHRSSSNGSEEDFPHQVG